MNQHTCDHIYQKYQEKAEETVKRLKNGEGITAISKSYGFNKDGFANWLAKNGYREKRKCRRKMVNTQEILSLAYKMCQKGISITAAAKELGVNKKGLTRDLKEKYGYSPLHDGKKRINDNYFNVIDSHEKAYWLGFLIADGHVSDNGKIEFCQSDERKECVEKFKKALGSQHKVAKHKDAWRISFQSPQMAQDLNSLGLTSNKSYDASIPDIPKEFLPSLLRGFFDGDGCIYIRKKDNHAIVEFTAASRRILEQIQEHLSLLGIQSGIYNTNVGRSANDNWSFMVSCRYAAMFLNYIYKHSNPETREYHKYNKYLFMLSCRPELKAV